MRAIVAIGGGEIGRPGYPVETTAIDEHILRLTRKARPRIVFLPTASGDSELYYDTFQEHFGGRLGCRTDVLRLLGQPPSESDIRDKILGSDAVYVGGGNTMRMLRIWRKLGVDAVLRQAWDQGVVLSGLSAGAICWFRYGSSDSRKFSDPAAGLMRISALGFVNLSLSPHYDVEEDRKSGLQDMMLRTPGVAIALDNCSAIEITDDRFRVLTSRPNAKAYRAYWSRGVYHEEVLTSYSDLPWSAICVRGPLSHIGT
jgi:dipeptidase E